MAIPLTVLIDLTEIQTDLEAAEREARSQVLADELQAGELVDSARLTRLSDLPEGAKPGMLAFIGSVPTTEITREKLKSTLDFLGNQFYGKPLTLEYEADGLKTVLEYRNDTKLDKALAAVERLEAIRIRVKEA